MGWGYPPYVPVAQRRAKAQREAQRLSTKGKPVSPVQVAGRAIASTFWGKASGQSHFKTSPVVGRGSRHPSRRV